MAETLRQAKAFDYYYSLGENRSYERVADQFNVSKNAVYGWSKKHNWRQRVADRDKANATKMFEDTDENVVESLRNYRKIIKASVGNYVKQLRDGVVKINSPSEFIKLVELDTKIAELIENRGLDKNGETVELNISFVNDNDDAEDNE